MSANVAHIRQPLPRRGGNSFYRDTGDRSGFAATLCGAAVTSQDVDQRDAARIVRANCDVWPVCQTCRALYVNGKRARSHQ